MLSTMTVLAWDKKGGDYKTTIVVDHVVRWMEIVEVDHNVWGAIVDVDKEQFEKEDREFAHTGVGVLLSNGEHLVLKMPLEDWEQLYQQSQEKTSL